MLTEAYNTSARTKVIGHGSSIEIRVGEQNREEKTVRADKSALIRYKKWGEKNEIKNGEQN